MAFPAAPAVSCEVRLKRRSTTFLSAAPSLSSSSLSARTAAAEPERKNAQRLSHVQHLQQRTVQMMYPHLHDSPWSMDWTTVRVPAGEGDWVKVNGELAVPRINQLGR